ncbi:hypothetical protein NPIL_489651, partial [Nephila pilipes]
MSHTKRHKNPADFFEANTTNVHRYVRLQDIRNSSSLRDLKIQRLNNRFCFVLSDMTMETGLEKRIKGRWKS